MEQIVLCPGSRSAPLAIAAEGLSEKNELEIFTCIDERSAAFFALGCSTITSKATAVITTSGSAVANLLPAAVEADRSCQPLLFLTADRPLRLKDCGANQTVNQQDFLKSICRWTNNEFKNGIHELDGKLLRDLIDKAWLKAHIFPGPVHLNLPFEEPLYPSKFEQSQVWSGEYEPSSFRSNIQSRREIDEDENYFHPFNSLDLRNPGVIILGPWRGLNKNLRKFSESLRILQEFTGWPIFADPVSGLLDFRTGVVRYWELLLSSSCLDIPENLQIIRLGPMPASRSLEQWLTKLKGDQLLITEGEPRSLDPTGKALQFSGGLEKWVENFIQFSLTSTTSNSFSYLEKWIEKDLAVEQYLEGALSFKGENNEPKIARALSHLLPPGLPVMLSASSPIRDWLAFSGSASLSRRVFSFRGASGIDGTLSLAMGLASAGGKMVLVTGDLAFLHDSNGLLFSRTNSPNLVILLIDNFGGGIFRQLDVDGIAKGDYEKIFTMPQKVDPILLARAYGIICREISTFENFQSALKWSLSIKGVVLLRVCTNSAKDTELREIIRNDLFNLFNH